MEQAARLAGAEGFIAKLPNGIDTYLQRPVEDEYSGTVEGTKTFSGRTVSYEPLRSAAGVPKAARRAERHEDVQEVLGEHQDSVVAEELLRRLGAAAAGAGENGFAFGVLWEAERQAARRARKRAGRLVR